MRNDVEFKTEDGVILRGWHYLPDNRAGKLPTIVMAHGFSAVKEMYLDHFAETFAQAGLASLVFDNRNFGASDGEPRQEIDPWRQVRDYRDAITYAETLPNTDGERIGIWGSSYSGGHVLVVGAIDRRVKCVVSQVPLISGHGLARRLIRSDMIAGLARIFEDDRRARYAGKPPAMIPVVSENPTGPAALPTADFMDVLHRDGTRMGTRVEKRGDAAVNRDVHRIRTRRLHQLHKPDPIAAGGGARRPPHRRRPCIGRL